MKLALAVTQEGEGPFVANTNDILYFGDGLGETGPSYQNNPIYTHPRVQEIRRNANLTTPLGQGDYKVTGVLVDPTVNNPSQGHLTPPRFLPTGAPPDGRVTGVSALDFNTTLSEIVVQNPGFRYSIPAKVNPVWRSGIRYERQLRFWPAVVEINGTDENGSITSYAITDPGIGYLTNPIISITGGGGYGAMAECADRF